MSVPDINDLDDEQIAEIADRIEAASENTSSKLKTAARSVWLFVALGSIGGLAALLYFDYITLDMTFTGTVNIAWMVEYFVGGVFALILIGLAITLLIATPANLASGLIRATAALNDDNK